MEAQSLDNILNGSPEPEIEAEAAPVVEPEQPRDEQGRFIPKGETPEPEQAPVIEGAPPAPVVDEPAHIPVAALKDERTRRQHAEARTAELERQIAAYQAPPATSAADQAQGVPDMFEDPVAYTAWLKNEAKSEAIIEARLEVSEMLARGKYADFDEKLRTFADLAQANPALAGELRRSPNPAEYAYTTAKAHAEISRYGSIDALVEAKVAERLAQGQPAAPVVPSLPPSLASERNVGSRSGPAWAGPRSISDILSG